MQPGEGAVEYAAEITAGLTREQAATVVHKLLTEPSGNPRVKRCEVCGYPFRDKTIRKTEQKAGQRARKDAGKPKKPRRYDEESFMRRLWNHEKPYDPDKLAQIAAARDRARTMGGGRKKPIRRADY